MADNEVADLIASLDDIVRHADETLVAARELESALDAEQKGLYRQIQRNGGANEDDLERIERVGADLQAVYATMALLALETTKRLDSSVDVETIRNEIQRVTQLIEARMERLKRIEVAADQLGKTEQAMEKLQEELKTLSAKGTPATKDKAPPNA